MKSLLNVALYLLVLNLCICLINAKEEKNNPSAPLDVALEKSNLRYRNQGSKNVGKKKAAKLTTQDSNSKKGSADINKTQSVNKGENGIPDFNDKDMSTIDEGYLGPNVPNEGNQSLSNEDTKVKPEKVTDKKEKGERKKGGRKINSGQTNPKSETQVNNNNAGTGKKKVSKKGESNKNEKSKQEANATPEQGVTMPVEGKQVQQEVAQVDVNGLNEVGSSGKSINKEKNESENSNPQVTGPAASLPTVRPIQQGERTTQWNIKRVDAPGYSNGVESVKGSEPTTTSDLEHKSETSYISQGNPKPEQVKEGKSGNVKNETSKEEKKLPYGKEDEEESKQNGASQDGNKKDGFSKKDIVKLFHENMDFSSLVENFKINEKLQKMSDELVTFAAKAYDGFLVFVKKVKLFTNEIVNIMQNF
ncbi:hypothetical protein PCYB_062980 [Plasmodium cynomolgi strain B]|uniref:Merozoite surface protein 7 n=1 Tax=Plasmodium cynomolgi (strain B) TaxID=1120755 RepID=K6UCW6_PLACD|nr:hypothetical protein PCYB_062980 [Plasmodium cynomolgi strain B]GAB65566.1 hypothetical protein PCYB_062980 [Plasmodium cynomolgi strain B]